MKSPIIKRSVVIEKHKTSVSVEDAFWNGLKQIADEQRQTISQLIARINQQRTASNLSSALRTFVLGHYRALHDENRAALPQFARPTMFSPGSAEQPREMAGESNR